MTPDERARLRASPVLYVAPDCPTCGARDGNAHRDRACLLDAPPEPPSDEIREALDAVKAEHGDVLRALAQSTDGSVQLQAKVDRLERELAEARDRGDVAVADHALVIVERYRLRAAGFWLIHLVNDVGKAGGKPEPGEWEEAWDSLRRALDGEEGRCTGAK